MKVSTGNSDNSGTSSNVWIKIFGPRQKSTNRLYLHLVDKEAFLPGSVEVFHLEGAELDEIKNVEVSFTVYVNSFFSFLLIPKSL